VAEGRVRGVHATGERTDAVLPGLRDILGHTSFI